MTPRPASPRPRPARPPTPRATTSAPTTPAAPGAVDANYTITYVDGSVTVKPVSLVITASSATVNYNDAAPTITAGYAGFVNGDTPASLTTAPTCSTTYAQGDNVGSYDTSCSGAVDANYTITYVDGSVTVKPVSLVITASSATVNYNDAAPTITAGYAGFVNGDTPASLTTAPTCSTTYAQGDNVGSYDTSCSGAVDANYTITYVDGSVTVKPVSLVITASSATVNYNDAAPTITARLRRLRER